MQQTEGGPQAVLNPTSNRNYTIGQVQSGPGGKYELAAQVRSPGTRCWPRSDRLMRLKSPSGRRVATTACPRPPAHIRCSPTLEISAFQVKEVSGAECRKPVGKVGDGTPSVKVLKPQVLVEPKVVAPSMGKRWRPKSN